MSAVHPDFLKLQPADIGRVGLDGAALLALVRYATAVDNGHDRVIIDGAVWWHASHADIGASLGGLGRELIRRLVSKLESAGELLSCVPTADSDRTRAYRLSDQPLHETDIPPTSHYTESTQGASESTQGASESCNPCVDSVQCTSIKELKEVKEDTESRALDTEAVTPATNPPGEHAPAKAGGKTRRKPRTQISDDYMPPEHVIAAIRAEYPNATNNDLSHQHRKFIDHYLKTGTPMANWDACWRNWIRTADERGELGRHHNGAGVRPSTTDALIAQTQALKHRPPELLP